MVALLRPSLKWRLVLRGAMAGAITDAVLVWTEPSTTAGGLGDLAAIARSLGLGVVGASTGAAAGLASVVASAFVPEVEL